MNRVSLFFSQPFCVSLNMKLVRCRIFTKLVDPEFVDVEFSFIILCTIIDFLVIVLLSLEESMRID